ncbi:uncharacterized protein LOC129052392 [Pongo abelii]|uniref:uncharacterized protein LOC129052392 n=1 Tax=Pongo abelii TaxID=9601 RepID=UPI0023E824FE|nr:uncharacterized protein LOC129052392 [Pongo abelii]
MLTSPLAAASRATTQGDGSQRPSDSRVRGLHSGPEAGDSFPNTRQLQVRQKRRTPPLHPPGGPAPGSLGSPATPPRAVLCGSCGPGRSPRRRGRKAEPLNRRTRELQLRRPPRLREASGSTAANEAGPRGPPKHREVRAGEAGRPLLRETRLRTSLRRSLLSLPGSSQPPGSRIHPRQKLKTMASGRRKPKTKLNKTTTEEGGLDKLDQP